MNTDLAAQFLQHMKGSRSRLKPEKIAAALDSILTTAHAVWPGFGVKDEAFLAHLARHLADASDLVAALEEVRGPDLYLAFACGRGSRKAHEILQAQYLAPLPKCLTGFRLSASELDELLQLATDKLLVGAASAGKDGVQESEPKILAYAGRGPLEGWLRVVVTRLAVSGTRRGAGRVNVEIDERILGPLPDAKIELVRRQHRRELTKALEIAFQSLTPKERTLLRMHFVEGLGIDQLSVSYRVHRATVARWIVRCREGLLSDVRRILRERLRLSPSEFESMLRATQSDLDATVSSLLRSRGPKS